MMKQNNNEKENKNKIYNDIIHLEDGLEFNLLGYLLREFQGNNIHISNYDILYV